MAIDNVTVFKLVSLVSIWVVGFGGGVLPFFIRQQNRKLMSRLNCLSGGVFLAGGFMHLLHAAMENPGLAKWSTVDEGIYAFPYAEMFCTIGFLGVLIIEQLAHTLQTPSASPTNSSSHHHPHDPHLSEDERDIDSAPFLEQIEGATLPPKKRKKSHDEHDEHLAFDKYDLLRPISGMLKSQVNKAKFIAYMFLFSMMSILGIIVGWCIADSEESEDVRPSHLVFEFRVFFYGFL
ncbi:hypothetical protein DYB32_006383 [Aphanomyces invadans]|uniref:Zinc/iron permease n=1 Tax=Aphanomyces invadans TaxID=157072 RepID=A0A3R6Z224_9STRA|nr:hypothetical protein DYB32_006383 [Aphanomyces invadans]